MTDNERETWNRDMRLSVGCGCKDPDASGVDHRYEWEGGCRPYPKRGPHARPPVGFRCKLRRPTVNRYRVADHGFRLTSNLYRGEAGLPTAWIGLALVVGAWSYGIRWGEPLLVRRGEEVGDRKCLFRLGRYRVDFTRYWGKSKGTFHAGGQSSQWPWRRVVVPRVGEFVLGRTRPRALREAGE